MLSLTERNASGPITIVAEPATGANEPPVDPPSRLQDLPPELLVLCADFLGVHDREAFFGPHPDFAPECRTLGLAEVASRADSVHALAALFALAQRPATPESTTVFMAIVRRASALLAQLHRARLRGGMRALLPDVRARGTIAEMRQALRGEILALEQLLCDCLGAVHALRGPQRTRLACACLLHVGRPFDALEEMRPGLQARVAAPVLEEVLSAAEQGSAAALRCLVASAENAVALIDLAQASTAQRQEWAGRLARLLCRARPAPEKAAAVLVEAADLVNERLPALADNLAPGLLRLLDLSRGAGLVTACTHMAPLFGRLSDAELKQRMLRSISRCTERLAPLTGMHARLAAGRIIALACHLVQQLPLRQRIQGYALVLCAFDGAGLHLQA